MRKHLTAHVVLCSTVIVFFASLILAAEPQQASTIYFDHDRNNFTATGNWIPADRKDKPAYPTETEIDCFRTSMSCIEATADFYMNHPHVTLNYLQVIRWDNDGIIARDSSKICMTVTIQIIFAEKRISSTHSMKQLDDKTKQSCNFFG